MEQYSSARDGADNFILCYKKYIKNITNYLDRMVGNRDVAQELAHDTFLKLYEKGYDLDPDASKTVNLIITVAKNSAFDHLKRKRNELTKYQAKHFEEVTLNEELYQSLEDHYIKAELLSTIRDTIDAFPDNMRGALIERLYKGEKVRSVAERRKLSKYLIRQAERELRKLIKEKYRERR